MDSNVFKIRRNINASLLMVILNLWRTLTMFGAKSWIFIQFLSATISPEVDLVSAPTTTPPSKTAPQIVVPVLVVFGVARPLSAKNAFLKFWKIYETARFFMYHNTICSAIVKHTFSHYQIGIRHWVVPCWM